jgi:hypothetical protein
MKWDFCSATIWGHDEAGPDGNDRFGDLLSTFRDRLGAVIETGQPINGYAIAFNLVRDGEQIMRALAGGTGSAAGSTLLQAENTAQEVYPLIQELFPRHGVSRLDAAEDYRGEGVYARLESMLTEVCTRNKVAMSPFGEGHIRPDGTRDATKGRSWYCGSKNSPVRIVLYEKGLQQLALGIPADPTWTRLEVRIRPSSKMKHIIGASNLQPSELFGMSRWTSEVGQYMGMSDIKRMQIGSIWRPSEQEALALKICRMFGTALDALLVDQGSPEKVGQCLFEALEKERESRHLLRLAA